MSQANNGGAGIPNVEEVLGFIEDYVRKQDDLEGLTDYQEALSGVKPQDKYQQAFSIIAGSYGQGVVNEIIRNVVESNIDANGNHLVPQAIKDFVSGIKNNNFKVNNIITTNFDTLLEEEFDNQSIPYNSFSVVADTQFQNKVNDNINIYHLHGRWDQGDTMHTTSQLQLSRSRIEMSLQNLVGSDLVVIMAYSGWEDSFTRSLATAVTNTVANYDILWSFYESEAARIEHARQDLFSTLEDAISRGRIQFYCGVDCNTTFAQLSQVSEFKKKNLEKRELVRQRQEAITFYDIEDRGYNSNVRKQTFLDSLAFLNRNNALSIRAALGYGVYDFISSYRHALGERKAKFLRIDCSEVLTRVQIEKQIKTETNQPLSQLIYLFGLKAREEVYFIIFDNIKSKMSADALMYLANLPDSLPDFGKNIFFIFSSSIAIKQFRKFHVELNALTLHESQLILNDRFNSAQFTQSQIVQIHDRSEGVVDKLEQIMDFLDNSSVEEVLAHEDIFDDDFHLAYIPKTTLDQIDLLMRDSSKRLTLRMLNILSILKNGETLTNLKRDKLGAGFNPKHVQELVKFELATTVKIDTSTTVIKINPIIKDYVLSKIPKAEVFDISNAYLKVTVIPTKTGVKLSSLNRKVYQAGYSTEEDNTGTLLLYAIDSCIQSISHNEMSGESNEMNGRRLNKLCYYSRAYVYILCNTSRYAELISAIELLLDTIKEVDSDNLYMYYEHLASAYRMRSNYSEAKKYLDLCDELCPAEDKRMLESLYVERLHLLEKTNKSAAIALARARKKDYHKNSKASILSDVVLAEAKTAEERFKTLVRLEKRARKLGYITTANNILFEINKERSRVEKIKNLDKAIESDRSGYNFCRAMIYKFQTLLDSEMYDRIKEQDINDLSNIYNYLFRQKFDSLFSQCHKLLWDIAAYRERLDIIYMIFYKGTIVWRLNSDLESEEKYLSLFQGFHNEVIFESLGYTAESSP
ncbi:MULTISPECIES: SIR2 family protein [unclassified Pseudoalteromonas]|uniref:SIR2 family protein n=1 Tax=unclassified Pseudoalteromonas TaxID=194690 RepID=UPI001F32E60C|nr:MULTISPECIES: SIR2 family protein [unclassified Pseudoalteromonas]MCF2825716.1 SIR2 family protein [Pseudoalteromonas sp. OF5H-5]MCF2832138.1 SIR2 family protein [Pseudoalteromonas sp. DL2-H6]MCF2923724.1 SIR2 family protein [Pseudoalteromonas sp. DL2-H1]